MPAPDPYGLPPGITSLFPQQQDTLATTVRPDTTTTTTRTGGGSTGRDVTRTIESPEQIQLREQQRVLGEQAAQIAGRKGQVGVGKAQMEIDIAEREQAFKAASAGRTAEARRGATVDVDKARKTYEDSVNKYKSTNIVDFWANRSTGQRIMDALIAAGGAYAATLTGGPNRPLQILNDHAESDFRRQRVAIDKLKDNVAMNLTGLGDAKEARKELLADLAAKEEAMWSKLGGYFKARRAAQGLDEAKVEADAAVQMTKAKEADARWKWLEATAQKVTERNTTEKPSTSRTTGGGGTTTTNTQVTGGKEGDPNRTPKAVAESAVIYNPRTGQPFTNKDGSPMRIKGPPTQAEQIAEKSARPAMETLNTAVEQLRQMKDILSLGRKEAMTSPTLSTLSVSVMDTLSNLKNAGVINEGERKEFLKELGAGNMEILLGRSPDRVAQVARNLEIKVRSRMNSLGLDGAEIMRQYRTTPREQPPAPPVAPTSPPPVTPIQLTPEQESRFIPEGTGG